MKKKIAFVVDKPNWAFYNNASNLKERLKNKYDIDIVSMSIFKNNLMKLFLLTKDYDLIHFFWRYDIYCIKSEFFEWEVVESGSNVIDFLYRYVDYNKITTGVYDHLFIDKDDEVSNFVFSNIKNYFVSSKKLKYIYDNSKFKYKPLTVINDGVDLNKFYPINLERFSNLIDREIVIGWVGNSNWSGDFDYKGLKTILEPAIDKLKKDGYNVKSKFADSYVKLIPYDKMVNYYSNIDILVCSSLNEGTPGPVLEAMACGVPVVATDVGVVNDAFGKMQKDFILSIRSVDEMVNKLKLLLDNKEKFKKISEENTKSIKKFSVDKIAKKYDTFFTKVLNNQGDKDDEKREC